MFILDLAPRLAFSYTQRFTSWLSAIGSWAFWIGLLCVEDSGYLAR